MRPLIFLVLASCTHDLAVYDRVEVPATARDLDLLFVFDDSPDRASYFRMASQLDVLQSQLSSIDGQIPNLHVGVVTTDLGTRGRLDALPGLPVGNCSSDGSGGRFATFGAQLRGSFLEDLRGPDGARMRNFDDDLGAELWQLTNPANGIADNGCTFAQPLEAMRRALGSDTNPGFLRPGAQLSVVFLTSDDDCSLARGALLDPGDASLGPLSTFRCTEQGVVCDPDEPRAAGMRNNCRPREGSPYLVDVSEYRSFLQQLKSDPRDVVVSAVAGARTPFEVVQADVPSVRPSCQGIAGSARPAVRLGALVDGFGGAFVDGCTQDGAYQQLVAPILSHQRGCFAGLRRSDGEDCTVIATAGATQTPIARCADGAAAPCWTIDADAAACPAGDHLGIAVRGNASTAGSRIEATCFIKETP